MSSASSRQLRKIESIHEDGPLMSSSQENLAYPTVHGKTAQELLGLLEELDKAVTKQLVNNDETSDLKKRAQSISQTANSATPTRKKSGSFVDPSKMEKELLSMPVPGFSGNDRTKELEEQVRNLSTENKSLKDERDQLRFKLEAANRASKNLIDAVEDRYYQLTRKLTKKEIEVEELMKILKESEEKNSNAANAAPPGNQESKEEEPEENREEELTSHISTIVTIGKELLTATQSKDYHLLSSYHKFDKIIQTVADIIEIVNPTDRKPIVQETKKLLVTAIHYMCLREQRAPTQTPTTLKEEETNLKDNLRSLLFALKSAVVE